MHEFIMDEKEEKQLRAELIFAKILGLIEDDCWIYAVADKCR